jgi:LmbE family N-acetylglucosaminyl deacetylase
MTHVFVSPHADDVALSCGGLIAGLREIGQNVAILTVFSGTGATGSLTPYQREALGFGSKTLWPVTEAFNRANIANDWPVYLGDAPPPWAGSPERLEATQADADAAAKRFWQRASWYRRANIHAEPLADQPLIDEVPTQGAILTEELVEAAVSGDIMAKRRLEDERYALFAEASIVFLDLPDAVFRGYEGDAELLGKPRADDEAPVERLRTELARLEPQKVYLPLGIGGHVDHQLVRSVGVALLAEGRRWVMPGPDYTGIVTFYEDFPYAWWADFTRLEDLPPEAFDGLPPDVSIAPEFTDVSDQIERKISGLTLYESQAGRQFGGVKPMADAVRGYGRKIAELGHLPGYAERYWSSVRI